MDLTAALPTFFVTLREGFEAALVVGIVLACLKKAEKTELYRWVYGGVGGGIVASVMVAFLLAGTVRGLEASGGIYAPVVKEILEGIFGLVAIAMLSWMLIWMSIQAKSVKSEVEQSITSTLVNSDSAGKGIFLLVFIAVLREGFEAVLFILAKFQQEWALPALGAFAGVAIAAGMGVLIFALGVKINIRLFFSVMGVFLLLIVGGLAIGALKHFDGAVTLLAQLSPQYANLCLYGGDSCLLGPQVWDGSAILPDRQFPGILLKTLFGYRQTLYLGQAVAYFLYLAIVGSIYWQSLRDSALGQKKTSVEKTG